MLLPGLNLHPSRLEALGGLLRGEGLPVFTPERNPEPSPRKASRSPAPAVGATGGEASATLSGAGFRYREWMGALHRTAQEMEERFPGISLSLCGISLGESHWNAFAGDVRHWLAPRAVKTEPLEMPS